MCLRLFLVMVTVLLTSCTLLETAAELPVIAVRTLAKGFNSDKTYDPIQLQDDTLRYADNFISQVTQSADQLKMDGKPLTREYLVLVKVRVASDMLSLATGDNALSNLVSMIVYTQSAQASINQYWGPKVFGDSANSMLAVIKRLDSEIHKLAHHVLTDEQIDELSKTVTNWSHRHTINDSDFGMLASITSVNQILQSSSRAKKNNQNVTSVFSLLDLDPLAGLDPATRELTETRLFGERAMFLGQRMPQLLEWQMELLTIRTSRVPEIEKFINSADKLASAGERVSKTAEQMPSLLSSEREKIMTSIWKEQHGLSELSKQVSQAFGQGSLMATSTEKALKAYSDILRQMDQAPKGTESASEPFHIKDYADAAVRIDGMTQRLTEFLRTLQPSLAPQNMSQLTKTSKDIVQQAQAGGRELVDYAFRMGIIFVVCTAVVVALVFLLTAFTWKTLISIRPR
jgi:hypothetical protein